MVEAGVYFKIINTLKNYVPNKRVFNPPPPPPPPTPSLMQITEELFLNLKPTPNAQIYFNVEMIYCKGLFGCHKLVCNWYKLNG